MENRAVKLALVQMSCGENKEENISKALARIDEAAGHGAKIVALQELFTDQYFCQKPDAKAPFENADTIPGELTERLSNSAKKNGIVLVAGSFFEKRDGKFWNTATVYLQDGTMAGEYRKTHIPEDILYHEQHYFESSTEGVKVFDTPYGKIAVLICYDQWFPEFARLAALKGAEIIFYPTAIGLVDEVVEENITGDWQNMWTNAQLGHAATNCIYVAAINRVGREDSITFWGGSFVANPSSKILVKGSDQEEILYADIDLSKVKPMQDAWRFLAERKPGMYGDLTK